ncbi:MAG: rhomboid family intramembrane serine protease [Verrucomicrobia bacterium]|nr:rhomboid family intramembrane serine protease [Verrucomicrobiota bacterium]
MRSWAETPWRSSSRWGLTPAVRGLLVLTVGISLFQWLADEFTGGAFTRAFALSWLSLRRGLLWTPLTYLFLHGSVMHVLLNMLILFFLGPETERFLGARKFVLLYLVSGVLGGIGWVLIERSPLVPCIGASGAVFGVLGAFAALFPEQPVTVLVFFILPVTLKAWLLAVILGVVELMYLISPGTGNVAYAAHLAGGLAGYFYALGLVRGTRETGGWIRRLRQRVTGPRDNEAEDSARMDRILDKVANQGLGSLNRRERAWLDRASRERREDKR